jgi:hypothetical protein
MIAMDAMNAMRRQALDAAAFSTGHSPRPNIAPIQVRALVVRYYTIEQFGMST